MKFKKPASAEKLKNLMSRQKVQSLFTFALGGLLLFQMVQFYQFRERLKFIDALYDRDSEVMSDLSQGKDYLSSFGSDLNEIREFLLLPTKDYDFSGLDDVQLSSEDAEEDLNTQLFDFVSSLGEYEQNKALYESNLSAVKASLADPVWATAGLTLSSIEGQALDDRMEFSFTDSSLEGVAVLKIDLGYDGLFSAPLYYREVSLTDRSSWTAVFEDLKEFLQDDLADLRMEVQAVNTARASLKTLLATPELEQVLSDKAMALSPEQEDDETFFYQLRNSQLAALGQFTVFKNDGRMEFSIEEPMDESFDTMTLDGQLSQSLLDALSNQVDARTDLQKSLDEKKRELASIMNDRAFVATLDKLGLHFGPSTETDTQVQYPLLNDAGETLRVIFIDKVTVEVKVMLPDGKEAQSLSMATEELNTSSKKKAWICLIPSPATLLL